MSFACDMTPLSKLVIKKPALGGLFRAGVGAYLSF